jgi:hypothetical protein
MPDFRKGAAEAEAAAAASSFAGRVDYLSLKDGDRVFYRMLTDIGDWITMDVHIAVPTKAAPKDYKGRWPKAMSFVCANDVTFRLRNPDGSLGDYEPGYGHCYVHEHMAGEKDQYGKSRSATSSQVYALCVLREPVMNSGRISGFRDKTEDWKDKDDKTHKVPAIRLITQKWSNFFGPMNNAAYVSGTVCDRDFMVERKANDYDVTAMGNATEDHQPGTASWTLYEETLKLRNISLEDIVVEQSSPERYGRFLDPAVEVKDRSKKDGKDGGEEEAAPSPQAEAEQAVTEDAIEALRADLMKSASTGGPADTSS